jgi:1-acyl-sn-glycerol-3-phosphate acyltransferase
VVTNLFFVIVCWPKLCRMAAHPERYTKEERWKHLQFWVERACKGGRIVLEAHGQEKLPEEPFILYPNHQGMFDVLAFLATSPRPFTFVFKKEAANLPLVKQVVRALHAYAIDREDIRQSMTVIQSMTEDVKNGRNFLIFAEGTRSRQGNKLLDFKGGSFKSATKAKCPIVPCALIDSFKPFDENSIKPVTVKLFYLPPMYYEEYKDMKTVEIAAEVKRRIEQVHMEEGCE